MNGSGNCSTTTDLVNCLQMCHLPPLDGGRAGVGMMAQRVARCRCKNIPPNPGLMKLARGVHPENVALRSPLSPCTQGERGWG
jgi:hypothetical protein